MEYPIADIATTELGIAVRDGDLNKIRLLLSKRVDPDERNLQGCTPIMLAFLLVRDVALRTEILRSLIGAGANVGATNNFGTTALMYAAQLGNEDHVKMLLKGSNVNASDDDANTALTDGAVFPSVVRLLLEEGANPNAQTRNGTSALMLAAGLEVEEAVDLLLMHGADPYLIDENGLHAIDHGGSRSIRMKLTQTRI